jgi:hypothetical protein
MPVTVLGYHGCHVDVARSIASGEPFRASENGYDWLGAGVYFWEDGPGRAAEWAEKRYGQFGAVVRAKVRLGHCLNLLDTAHFDRLDQTYRKLLVSLGDLGIEAPKNVRKRHELDYLVVETYNLDFKATRAGGFQTVRGCFPEGKPLYEGSKILRETHIQIAVRDARCIRDVAVVH